MPSTPMTSAAQGTAGIKQQELDLARIYMVTPELTPFASSIDMASGLLKQELAEWEAESFQSVISTATPDNAPTTSFNRRVPAKIQAYPHYFRDAYKVSKLANANAVGGGINRGELGKQRRDSLERIRLMEEQQFLSDDDTAADNGTTGYTTRGVFKWLSDTAQSNLPVPDALRPTAGCNYTGAFASLTEDLLVGLFNAAYQQVKARVDYDLFAGVDLKNLIDKFTIVHPDASSTSQARVSYVEKGTTKYNRNVEVLDISTAMVRVHLVHLVKYTTSTGEASARSTKCGVFLNLAMWKKQDLIALNHEELPRDGSGYSGQYEMVRLLKCGNPQGQGKIDPAS